MEIKHNLDNPNINKDSITYDPIKYMNEKDLMKRISLNRTMTSNLFSSQKRFSNPISLENSNKKNNNALLGRMSVMTGGDNTINIGTENYNNIYTNSRMTNSFGNMTDEKLSEFYSFEDDFD